MRSLRFQFALLAIVSLPLGAFAATKDPETVVKPKELSLVRVNVTGQPYDFVRPWQKKAPFSSMNSNSTLPDSSA